MRLKRKITLLTLGIAIQQLDWLNPNLIVAMKQNGQHVAFLRMNLVVVSMSW